MAHRTAVCIKEAGNKHNPMHTPVQQVALMSDTSNFRSSALKTTKRVEGTIHCSSFIAPLLMA